MTGVKGTGPSRPAPLGGAAGDPRARRDFPLVAPGKAPPTVNLAGRAGAPPKLRPNPPKPPGPPPAHLLRRPPPPSLEPRGAAAPADAQQQPAPARGLAGLAIATEGEQQPSWVQHWDEEVESFYYFNHATGEASWVRPSNFKPSPTAAAAHRS